MFYALLVILSLVLSGCVSVPEETKKPNLRVVKATWYGIGDGSGKHTANGERFNPHGLTAAHKTLKFNTKVKITNPKNGRNTIVRITDRGPFVKGVEIDLTKGAANAIGMVGTQHVQMEILKN